MRRKTISKICKGCGEEKGWQEFTLQSDTKDGRKNLCRRCCSKKAKAYYIAHREKLLAKANARNAEHRTKE